MSAPSAKKNEVPQGASPFDCNEVACMSKLDMLKKFGKREKLAKNNKPEDGKDIEGSKASAAVAGASTLACPPTRGELGVSGWSILHSIAAYYPEKPSKEDEVDAKNFVNAFAKFYPCTYCAKDFQEEIEKDPPKTKSREDFSVWMCKQHNTVNKKLGVPTFPCTMSELDKRWRTGVPECWKGSDMDETASETLGQDVEP